MMDGIDSAKPRAWLLELPLEVRWMIYDVLLGTEPSKRVIALPTLNVFQPCPWLSSHLLTGTDIALASSCRQL